MARPPSRRLPAQPQKAGATRHDVDGSQGFPSERKPVPRECPQQDPPQEVLEQATSAIEQRPPGVTARDTGNTLG